MKRSRSAVTALACAILLLGSPEFARSAQDCTYTQGFWKNHPDAWSTDGALCGEDWLTILRVPPRGDAFYIAAHQWIAATLNVANGASTTQEVDEALARLESAFGSCSIPREDRERVLADMTLLDHYNNGLEGPGHCDDAPTPTPVPTMVPSPTPSPSPNGGPTPTPVEPAPTPSPSVAPPPSPTPTPTPVGPEPTPTTIPRVPVACRDGVGLSLTAFPPVVAPEGGYQDFTVRIWNDPDDDSSLFVGRLDGDLGLLDGRGDCVFPQHLGPGATYACTITEYISPPGGDRVTFETYLSGERGDPARAFECSARVDVLARTGVPRPCPHCPSKLMFRDSRKDFFSTEGYFDLGAGFDPLTSDITVLLSDSSGVIYNASLYPGDLTASGRKYSWKDKVAKTGPGPGLRNGLYKVEIKEAKTGDWRIKVRAYGDLARAVDGEMAITVIIDDQVFQRVDTWNPLKKGWQLKRYPD